MDLPAIAHEVGFDFDIAFANEISEKTPNVCHLAFRSLITDHNHITRHDLTALDRRNRVLLALKDTRGTCCSTRTA